MKKWGPLALIIAIAVFVFVWFGLNQAQTDKETQERAVRHGLVECYVVATCNSSSLINSEQIENIVQSDLQKPTGGTRFFPSFIKRGDLYYSARPVATNSSNIVCAVRLAENVYVALHGDGHCSVIAKNDFLGWPHVQ